MQEEGDREQKLVLRRHDQATLHNNYGTDRPLVVSERVEENYQFFRELLVQANPEKYIEG